jgi:hypothetical protein
MKVVDRRNVVCGDLATFTTDPATQQALGYIAKELPRLARRLVAKGSSADAIRVALARREAKLVVGVHVALARHQAQKAVAADSIIAASRAKALALVS